MRSLRAYGSLNATQIVAFPAVFSAEAYRRCNGDLADYDDDEILDHYRTYGESEGRRANALATRDDFIALVPAEGDRLEIGPYHSPQLGGPGTRYLDVLSREEMVARAEAEGFDGSTVPHIDYVSRSGDCGAIGSATFDAVFSSHAIEHQPDLIRHVRDVERVLRPGGCYFAIVPDKRFCFDHFIPESTLPHIIAAHREARTAHTLASVLEHSVLTTHNDCARHWTGDHGTFMEACVERTLAGLAEHATAGGTSVDVHAWYFTPASTPPIFHALEQLRYTHLTLERLYPTRRDQFEFWMILRKPA